ncbi:hypothetical protein BDW71DRAFT_196781 [Aspergillus fruticulosus]
MAISQSSQNNISSTVSLRSEALFKTAFSNQIPVEARSDSGRTLRKPAGSLLALVFEGFLCLVALCFIGTRLTSEPLALVALCIRNRPTGDSLGSAMEQAMRLGPTIYPILFAALLSRSLKSIGRYCAQRSVRMSTLWALMNTNATADPILHLVSMPASILVWGLLVLWAMSPLGGQSTIRLLYKANVTNVTHPELRYWDSGPLGNMFINVGIMEGNDGSWPLSMRDIYSASLMQSVSTKAGPLDQWGNVKIPRIEAGNESQVDPAGWMPIKKSLGPETFTSLFGMPIVGLPEMKKQGDLNLTIEATYVVLSTPSTYGTSSMGKIGMTPRTLRFNNTFGDMTVTTCQVTQRMVEAFIECVDGSCEATKVRPSTTDHRDKNFTSFDYWAWIVLDMLTSVGSQKVQTEIMWGVGSSVLFLNDSSSFLMQTGISGTQAEVNISNIDPALFSTRASILLNTGLQAFMAPTGFSGQLPTNLSLYGVPHVPGRGLQAMANQTALDTFEYNVYAPPEQLLTILNDLAPFVGASTNATFVRYTEVYRPEYVWTVILIISSVLLFAVGVAGICVRLKTFAPNMFDPVAGMTYNNPYISLTGREYDPLDADERANLLGDKRVQIGEVDDYKGVKAVFGEVSYVTPLRLGIPYH